MKRRKEHAALLLMFAILAIEEYGYESEAEFLKDCRKAFRYRSAQRR